MQRNMEGVCSKLGEGTRGLNECRTIFVFISFSNSSFHPNGGIRGHQFQFSIPWLNSDIQTHPKGIWSLAHSEYAVLCNTHRES
jgi:hypothetical protein